MGQQDFDFEAAILIHLKKWLYGNKYLLDGLRYPDAFFIWEGAELKVNLNVLKEEYVKKFIVQDLDAYCNRMVDVISKLISQFLAEHKFPSINLNVLFVYYGKHKSSLLKIEPLRQFPKMKVYR
ncbi:hypothetical protein CPT03_10670 [Pedobacter ginsengisoli]|uniref:Uncharacterized protein n=1 Tax=Pedobacter ginsengisoli TaxID=363852 RepID=A0A2D1U5Q2_9SPHI|nr:hypothetical protein [Pedobacter ginsengisoli]ATP56908.1 hypothetical protein CPT03_10670 [Pedobacter ginsengisoli]